MSRYDHNYPPGALYDDHAPWRSEVVGLQGDPVEYYPVVRDQVKPLDWKEMVRRQRETK